MAGRVRAPLRPAECLLVVAVLAGGVWLRWTHLATPSLWYDELVHVRTAERPTVAEVWRAARVGAAPAGALGTGNAGAVPLDYLALHAWTRVAPPPTPDTLERHYRTPAFLFAVLALPLAWALARSAAGPVAGLVALALLATSVPHVLYAAEARFYSLYVLATFANLAAFVALVRAPSIARTVVFTVVNVGSVLSALYGVFPIAAEYLVLTALALRARDGRSLAIVAASGLAAAAVVGAWVAPSVGTVYARGAPVLLHSGPALAETLRFFAGGARPLAVVFGFALATVAFLGPRDRVARALGAVVLLSVCALPAMVAIAHWKHYYYHPRHGLFLLPMAHLATALVAARLLASIRPPLAGMLVGAGVVLSLSATTVRAYVATPLEFFERTKTHRDFRGLARAIAARTAAQPRAGSLLLLLEKRRPGQLANPTLAFYLQAYGLTDRIMLAGIGDPLPILRTLPATCATLCRGETSIELFQLLGVRDPFNQPRHVRRFLELPHSDWSPELAGVAVVAWAPNIPVTTPPGIVRTPFDGAMLYELAKR
jgi:hypothetical protein